MKDQTAEEKAFRAAAFRMRKNVLFCIDLVLKPMIDRDSSSKSCSRAIGTER